MICGMKIIRRSDDKSDGAAALSPMQQHDLAMLTADYLYRPDGTMVYFSKVAESVFPPTEKWWNCNVLALEVGREGHQFRIILQAY